MGLWCSAGRRRCARNQRGVTSIEYALIGALIAMAVVATVGVLGVQLQTLYEFVSDKVSCVAQGKGDC